MTQRINLSLQRLSAQTGRSATVARLLRNYQALLSLYRQAAQGNIPAASSRAIRAAELRATTAARALHLPLCAPGPFSPP